MHAMPGHSVYAPERNGVPVYMCRGIRASFGASMNATTTIFYRGARASRASSLSRTRVRGTRNITTDARVPMDEPKGKPWHGKDHLHRKLHSARVSGLHGRHARQLVVAVLGQGSFVDERHDFSHPARLPRLRHASRNRWHGHAWRRCRSRAARTSSSTLPQRNHVRPRPSTKSPQVLGIVCRNDYRSDPRRRNTIRPRARQDGVVCPRSSSGMTRDDLHVATSWSSCDDNDSSIFQVHVGRTSPIWPGAVESRFYWGPRWTNPRHQSPNRRATLMFGLLFRLDAERYRHRAARVSHRSRGR